MLIENARAVLQKHGIPFIVGNANLIPDDIHNHRLWYFEAGNCYVFREHAKGVSGLPMYDADWRDLLNSTKQDDDDKES